ncbi:hypothetical protein N7528_000902 [Penicillium herquei]|nr:hypothetical protein N7528_000902 [Penicillium herquei]
MEWGSKGFEGKSKNMILGHRKWRVVTEEGTNLLEKPSDGSSQNNLQSSLHHHQPSPYEQ